MLTDNTDGFDNLANHFDEILNYKNNRKVKKDIELTDLNRTDLRSTKLLKTRNAVKVISFNDFNFIMKIRRKYIWKGFPRGDERRKQNAIRVQIDSRRRFDLIRTG